MESFTPYNQIDHPAMKKSHLNSLLIILIVTFMASGAALIVLRQIDSYHREQLYIAEQATLPVHKVSKLENEKIRELDFVSPSTTPETVGNIANWKIYKNEEYGFSFEYPGYFNVAEPKSQELFSITTQFSRDRLSVSVENKALDNYTFDNPPYGFSCTYNAQQELWSAQNYSDQKYCPQKIKLANSFSVYITGVADGVAAADIGYIVLEKQNRFLILIISRGYGGDVCSDQSKCPNDYPLSSKKTLEEILSTFKFTK